MKKITLLTSLFALGMMNVNAKKIIIGAEDIAFNPKVVAASIGDTIVWNLVGAGFGYHTTTSTTIPPNAISWDAILDGTNTSFQYVIAVNGKYSYECTPHVLFGIDMTGTINVGPIAPVCNATITTKDSLFCAGDSLILTANQGASYLWSNGDTTQTIIVKQAATFSVKVTDSKACVVNSAPMKLTKKPLPLITANDTTVVKGKSVVLATNATGNSTFMWRTSPDLSCTTCSNPTATPTKSTTYYLMVHANNGCMNTDSVYVAVTFPAAINQIATIRQLNAYPNPFSTSTVINIGDLGTSKNLSFSMYDILGNLVKTVTSISNEQLIINRTDLVSGIYFYQLKDTETTVAAGRLVVE